MCGPWSAAPGNLLAYTPSDPTDLGRRNVRLTLRLREPTLGQGESSTRGVLAA